VEIPDYWLPRPAPGPVPEVRAELDAIWQPARDRGSGRVLDEPLPVPKWQFLCHLADVHGLALHGSGDPNIEVFEPRQANDLGTFGNQKAVYAAGDGIWAMFFAIVDRARVASVTNACFRLVGADGTVGEPLYLFSVSQSALPSKPWRRGTVYVLPKESFVTEEPLRFGELEARIPHLASFEPVTPLARISVVPEDFPFLAQIRGHDDDRLAEYGEALQTGAPWPD
jgi:hypothetical protein